MIAVVLAMQSKSKGSLQTTSQHRLDDATDLVFLNHFISFQNTS